jgi:hypothetical protein
MRSVPDVNPADYSMRRVAMGLIITSAAIMLVIVFALWGALR